MLSIQLLYKPIKATNRNNSVLLQLYQSVHRRQALQIQLHTTSYKCKKHTKQQLINNNNNKQSQPIITTQQQQQAINVDTSTSTDVTDNTKQLLNSQSQQKGDLIYENLDLPKRTTRRLYVAVALLPSWAYFITFPYHEPSEIPVYISYISAFLGCMGLAAPVVLNLYTKHIVYKLSNINKHIYNMTVLNTLNKPIHYTVYHNDIHHGKMTYANAISHGTYKFKWAKDNNLWYSIQYTSDNSIIHDSNKLATFLKYDTVDTNLFNTKENNRMVNENVINNKIVTKK